MNTKSKKVKDVYLAVDTTLNAGLPLIGKVFKTATADISQKEFRRLIKEAALARGIKFNAADDFSDVKVVDLGAIIRKMTRHLKVADAFSMDNSVQVLVKDYRNGGNHLVEITSFGKNGMFYSQEGHAIELMDIVSIDDIARLELHIHNSFC